MATGRFDLEVCNQDTNRDTFVLEKHFKCMICLNLVYKPVVQSCGHMFCFWCVYRAMNPKMESACVMCRSPYLHFPRICALVHFFLLKAAPLAYAARARETQAMEEAEQVYSPRTILIPPKRLKPQKFPSSEAASKTSEHRCEHGLAHKESVRVPGNSTLHDFPCALCHELLYRPVVLRCGEVFCESCLKNPASVPRKCPSCRYIHQGPSSNVCLELHHFLEVTFPMEYKEREQEITGHTESIDCSSLFGPLVDHISCSEGGPQFEIIHAGVGCDNCGMYPIVGPGFQCKDCHEKVSYDLCGQCKEITSSNEGRFNQNHQSSHHMEEVTFKHPHNRKQGIRFMRISPSMAQLISTLHTHGTLQGPILRQQEQCIANDDFDDYINCLM